MAPSGESLQKDLGTWQLFAIAIAPTLSSGFFLLPGLVYADAGPAIIISYGLAVLLVIPALMCKIELTTAMPKAGGVYYFLDRSLGPWVGTITGMGTWLVMIFKSAFALIGVGAYLGAIWPDLPAALIAAGLAGVFAALNLIGVKESGQFQVYLVVALLLALAWFGGTGAGKIETGYFTNFFREGPNAILATVGAVFISFAGMTKVASVAEEVEDPETTVPRAVFGALATTALIYIGGLTVMIGLLEPGEISGNPAPMATAAERATGGPWGLYVIVGAALLGFLGTANAGIMSGARYPLAMSRDQIMPAVFKQLNTKRVPHASVLLTGGLIAGTILLVDPHRIAKLGGVFKMMVFGLICLAVLVMRESRLGGYDPSYRTPLYPWVPLIGVVAPLWIIGEMGVASILFSAGLIVLSAGWYRWYAAGTVSRSGALHYLFHRWGRHRDPALKAELRDILQEKGPRPDDPIGQVVAAAPVIDVNEAPSVETLTRIVTRALTETPEQREQLAGQFLQAYEDGFEPVSPGVAIPHVRAENLSRPRLAIARVRAGIPSAGEEDNPIYALLVLISPDEAASQHLRILAHLAEQIQEEDFLRRWREGRDEQELKEFFLPEDQFRVLQIQEGTAAAALSGRQLGQIDWPAGVVVGMIRRNGEVIVPDDRTVLRPGDRLTLTGDPKTLGRIEGPWLEARTS